MSNVCAWSKRGAAAPVAERLWCAVSLQRRFQNPAQPTAVPISTVNGQRLLTLKQAAVYIGSHLWAVRQMLRNREIRYIKIGRSFVIDIADLDRWIERKKIGVVA